MDPGFRVQGFRFRVCTETGDRGLLASAAPVAFGYSVNGSRISGTLFMDPAFRVCTEAGDRGLLAGAEPVAFGLGVPRS